MTLKLWKINENAIADVVTALAGIKEDEPGAKL